jgi:hypothetical protein
VAAGVSGRTILVAVVALGVGIAFGPQLIDKLPAPVANFLRIGSPDSESSAMLASVRELNRLDVFAASLTGVVTSKAEGLLGIDALATRKTLIVPGTVTYYIDFSQLTARDVNWDAAHKLLTVTLPEPQVATPAQPLSPPLTYKDGELVMALTGSEATLDAANYAAAKAQIMRLAASRPLRDMARTAARTAVTNNLQLPLRAVGADARVDVRFAGAPAEEKS